MTRIACGVSDADARAAVQAWCRYQIARVVVAAGTSRACVDGAGAYKQVQSHSRELHGDVPVHITITEAR